MAQRLRAACISSGAAVPWMPAAECTAASVSAGSSCAAAIRAAASFGAAFRTEHIWSVPTLGLQLHSEPRLPNEQLWRVRDVHHHWRAATSDQGGQLRSGERDELRLRLSHYQWGQVLRHERPGGNLIERRDLLEIRFCGNQARMADMLWGSLAVSRAATPCSTLLTPSAAIATTTPALATLALALASTFVATGSLRRRRRVQRQRMGLQRVGRLRLFRWFQSCKHTRADSAARYFVSSVLPRCHTELCFTVIPSSFTTALTTPSFGTSSETRRPTSSAVTAVPVVAAASASCHRSVPAFGLQLHSELRLPDEQLRRFRDVHHQRCASTSDQGSQL